MARSEPSPAANSIGRHLTLATLAIVILLGGIGGWAVVTNLAGAVVTSGQFVVDSHVKTVKHSTGGIVGAILVREGQKVDAGEVLIRLDATQTTANLAIVTKRLDEMSVRRALLEAERDNLPEIVFSPTLLALSDNSNVAAAIRNARRLFVFRRQSREGKKHQLLERISQYENEVVGTKAQELAYDRGLAVLETELSDLRGLHGKGLVTMQRLNALDREAATLGGKRGEAIAGQAQIAGRITETRMLIQQIDQDLRSEVAAELREVRAQVGEYSERKISAEDDLKRIDIIAPQSGVVHQLAIHTIGGVISPAETIMQIVPDSDQLALEVRISPQDIDQVYLGQKTVLRMSAFNQRTTPELNGSISRIAADLAQDQITGLSYYSARIKISDEELAQLGELVLVPGMPAEAFIQTGKRTVISYLVKPLSDQISRAFKEE
ncbi:MAG: hemolysin secretion protein D [Hyphomicrobiales bacterium]|nr:MAG: hemolysin secretion protein D [Hyphomicrobiales bacterium]